MQSRRRLRATPPSWAALRARLEADTERGRFSGAVLITRDGRTLFEGAYGLADRERDVPNTPLTQFRMGSMNKMLTAVATLQLVQAGKLRLDAPLGAYLPDYPNADVASKVTIHHLLTHTGGTGDIFGPAFMARRSELRNPSDYLELYGTRVEDLARFAAALQEHRLLDSAHTALLLSGKVAIGQGQYAYGFVDRVIGGRRFVGHSGGTPGMNGDLAFEATGGYVVVVLSNLDPPAARQVAAFILDCLPTRRPPGGGRR